jgi:hypothetical protein
LAYDLPELQHQGRLVVMVDLTRDRLYLHCEECESGWCDLWKVGDPNTRFLTTDEEFEARVAIENDLHHYGWPLELFHALPVDL